MTPRPTSVPVALRDACHAIGVDGSHLRDLEVTGITIDSRDVCPGDLFAALPGERAHGAEFLAEAVRRGAVAVLTDELGARSHESRVARVPAVVVPDPRGVVGALAAEIYGRPADDLLMLGVTGTNGKTTTCFLLDAGLRAAGHRTGVIGTVATMVDGEYFPTVRTTPEAPQLHALLAVMRERGVTAVAMEVSSHALAMGRVDGCLFDVAGFTQLGSDHLDFHGTDEAYFAAKQRLFTPHHARRGVVVVDDPGGRRMAAASAIETVTVGCASGADWQLGAVNQVPGGGHQYRLTSPDGDELPGEVSLMGDFNVANAALAQVMLLMAGLDAEPAARGIARCRGVPGRMERIGDDTDVVLLVDYAHTADAIARAVDAARSAAGGRIIVVFGCGGDRDAGKRPAMGQVAAEHADVVVVTDDNPRGEPPAQIRAEIMAGATTVDVGRRAEIREIGDRRAAIDWAVGHARPGDIVLVTGKGHETGQEGPAGITPFDDRVEVLHAWRRRAATTRAGGGLR